MRSAIPGFLTLTAILALLASATAGSRTLKDRLSLIGFVSGVSAGAIAICASVLTDRRTDSEVAPMSTAPRES